MTPVIALIITAAATPYLILIFLVLITDNNFSYDHGISLVELTLLGFSIAINASTLYVAIKAYNNWHKPDKLKLIIEGREELNNNASEVSYKIISTLNRLKEYSEQIVGLTVRHAPINGLSLAQAHLYSIKDNLEILKNATKEIDTSSILKNKEILYHKNSEAFKKSFENFYIRSLILSVFIKRNFERLDYLINAISNEIDEKSIDTMRDLIYNNNLTEERTSLIDNSYKDLKNTIEIELDKFIKD